MNKFEITAIIEGLKEDAANMASQLASINSKIAQLEKLVSKDEQEKPSKSAEMLDNASSLVQIKILNDSLYDLFADCRKAAKAYNASGGELTGERGTRYNTISYYLTRCIHLEPTVGQLYKVLYDVSNLHDDIVAEYAQGNQSNKIYLRKAIFYLRNYVEKHLYELER